MAIRQETVKMSQASAPAAADAVLDATGLLCPLPVLKARRALKPLAPGAVLEVLATDPGAVKDFEHFCRTTGCEMVASSEQPGGVLRFLLRKPE
jgi:tRNA 2-thiouridine synthesizing protein A